MPILVDEIFQAVKRIRDAGMTVLIVEQRMAECPRRSPTAPISCRLDVC